MRKKKFVLNSISSLMMQIVNIVCGFILPHLILEAYGTEINGLISSITQFLTVISLSEFGMTAVVQSALYKPLADRNIDELDMVMSSATRFFRKIGSIMIIYIAILCIVYPIIISTHFDFPFVTSLIIILGINQLAQYMFGITNMQLISADQKLYVMSITNIVTVIGNTVACYFAIHMGANIHVVKMVTMVVFLFRPIVASVYVRYHYTIHTNIHYEGEPIKQKWNGIAQHFSYYVFTSTDVLVLTIWDSLSAVSIYSVHVLILNGLKQICSLFENAIKPILGEEWAKNDTEKMRSIFSVYEWFMHFLSTVVFGCAISLIVSFVLVYTKNVTDTNYYVPVFALLISLAYAVQNIRNPYNTLIQAVGHYKQTQTNYILVAVLNICISITLVSKFGIIGVAIGTLVSAFYQTTWQACYLYYKVLNKQIIYFLKLLVVDLICFCAGLYVCSYFQRSVDTYCEWFFMAIPIGIVWGGLAFTVNYMFYKDYFLTIFRYLRRKRV